MAVDLKYKIRLKGRYWAGINNCPDCHYHPDSIYGDIIGFANSSNGLMTVVECPECFIKWYYHTRENETNSHYEYFLKFIKFGMQKHYKLCPAKKLKKR